MPARFISTVPVEGTAYIAATLFAAQARLRFCVPFSAQAGSELGNTKNPACVAAQFTGLVEAALYHPYAVQRYGDQCVRQGNPLNNDMFTHQVAQNPAFSKLAVKLQGPHQVVCRKAILQRTDSAAKARRVLYALPTDLILCRRQRQAALTALGSGPWQVSFARFADTYCT